MDADFHDFLLTHVGGWLGEFKVIFVEQVGDEVQNVTFNTSVCVHALVTCLPSEGAWHCLVKECPPSIFGLISCIGSKFTQMNAHPGVSVI